MKITTNQFIDYDSKGYSESEGWHSIYSGDSAKYTIIQGYKFLTGGIIMVGTLLAGFFNLKPQLDSISEILLYPLVLIAVSLFVVMPAHEIIHLLALTPHIFTNKCHIMFGFKEVTSFFDGVVSRKRFLLSLLMPFIIMNGIIVCVAIITNGTGTWMPFILLISIITYWMDFYKLHCVLAKTPKDAVFYGNKYKIGLSD